ncbi:MAG TPA: hypothetical protein VHA14_19780, partial [Bryobacteraceae bacterium]|nr:hypothetical protein [Bryobacteraceae bacterium]
GSGFVPIRLTCLPAIEFAGESSGSVNQTRAFSPAAPALFKLAGPGIFGMSAFAFFSVTTIKFERHTASFPQRHCTLLHAGYQS